MAMKEVPFRNFSGGLNTRDLASELAENEFPAGLNITVDERGGVMKRLGYINRYSGAIGTGLVVNAFYWDRQDKFVYQIGTGMHLDDAASFHTWSTSARCGMCEFDGKLIMIHPIDGMKVYDASSVTTPTNAPKGTFCATWQNKVWSGGDPVNPPRLNYSDIGSPNATAATQYVDIREKDSDALVAGGGAAGLDISGRPGLLVFKSDSAYRVHDSATGAYTTIDTMVGAGSNISLVNAYGRTYAISTKGIYSTDGLSPMQENSQLIENFFHQDHINQTRPDLLCAGRHADRVYFSLPLVGDTENGIVIELHPTQNWVCAHSNAASCYAFKGHQVTDLVFGSPSVAGRVYTSHNGGSDAGAAIASTLQFNWKEPNGGHKVRVRRARFVGSGTFDATMIKNYEVSPSGRVLPVAITSSAALYDSGFNYDDPASIYGPTAFQGHQDFWHVGVGRALSFIITESSTISGFGRPIMGGASPEIGGWSLSHVNMLCIDLGYR